MRRLAAPILLACAACAHPATPIAVAPAPAARAPTPTIDSAALRRDLYAFADDSMRGRDAQTVDGARAARFIAGRLAALGLEPAGDSGFFQRVPLAREWVGPATTFEVTTPGGATHLPLGRRLLPVLSFGDGLPLPRLEAHGDIVFAGYALTTPERDDLAGLDVADKVVVFVNDAPPGMGDAARDSLRTPEALGQRLAALVKQRPAAIIVLATGELAAQLPAMASTLTDTSVRLAAPASTPRVLPMLLFGQLRSATALLPVGWPADDRAQPLTGRRFAGRVDLRRADVPAYNVVGVVRGADPALRSTYVAFGAHLDHIGVQTAEHGDSIANGADDDGSGSTALLAIARAAAAMRERPRRSLLFVWHTAEELGLYGSEWFTEHPSVPLDSVVAQLNADMIGRNAPDSLYLVGPAAAPHGQSRLLGAIVDSVNASLARPFLVNREWDSPTHPEQIYYRSDHYNYAKHGVPIVFFTSGLHADYHRVTDSPDKIDFDKLTRVATLIFRSGLAVADRVARPIAAEVGQ